MQIKEPETSVSALEDMYAEVRNQFVGQNKFIDTVAPPVVFMLANYFWGLALALLLALGAALVIAVLRLARRDRLWFALGGLGAVFFAAFLAWWMARAASFFLPSIIVNALLLVLFLGSLVAQKPLVALGSHAMRSWPLAWYWHPRILPAYMEVSLGWTFFMAFRLIVQVFLFQNDQTNALGVFQILTGSPTTIVLLAGSYLYGVKRLGALNGPSVMEFKQGSPPPWEGQQRGF